MAIEHSTEHSNLARPLERDGEKAGLENASKWGTPTDGVNHQAAARISVSSL